jgi:PAS domain S-box-containing protein
LHSLLQRQLRRHVGLTAAEAIGLPAAEAIGLPAAEAIGPDSEASPQWQAFLAAVDDAYVSFDSDREMIERALELSSQELLQANVRLRAIFASIPDTLFVLHASGAIRDVKGARLRHCAIEPESMPGKNIAEVLGQLAGMVQPTVATVLQNGSPSVCEVVRMHGEHAHSYEGRITRLNADNVVLVLRDLTDGRRSGELLELNERRLNLLLANSSELVVVVSRDGVLQYASQSVERIMSLTPEDQLGLNVLSLIHPEDISVAVQALAAMIPGSPGVHPPIDIRLRHKSGHWIKFEAIGNNRLDDPAVNGIIINARPIADSTEAAA